MPETSEDYWNRIGGKVLSELERRLGEAGDAADLPGTLLMRLAEQYLKYLDKKAQDEEGELQYMTALEAIDQEGLPKEAKIQILKDYLDKLYSDVGLATAKLEELLYVKEVESDAETVHEQGSPVEEGSLA